MRRFVRVALFALFALAAAIAGAQEAAAPLRVGDQWVYQRTGMNGERRGEETVRITLVDAARRTLIESTTGASPLGSASPSPLDVGMARRQVRRDPATLELFDVDVLSGSLPLVRMPLREHTSWTYLRRSRIAGGEQLEEGRADVLGRESIEVPAGRFDAWRIRHRYTAVVTGNPAFQRVTTIELWYVPAVKRWVRLDFDMRGSGVQAERYRLELTQVDVDPS